MNKDISYERFLNNKIRLPQIDYDLEDIQAKKDKILKTLKILKEG